MEAVGLGVSRFEDEWGDTGIEPGALRLYIGTIFPYGKYSVLGTLLALSMNSLR